MLSAQGSERALLMNLLARLRALDADVYVGHNIGAFDLDVLLHRLQHHKVPTPERAACGSLYCGLESLVDAYHCTHPNMPTCHAQASRTPALSILDIRMCKARFKLFIPFGVGVRTHAV
jgi:hypothetical protein